MIIRVQFHAEQKPKASVALNRSKIVIPGNRDMFVNLLIEIEWDERAIAKYLKIELIGLYL